MKINFCIRILMIIVLINIVGCNEELYEFKEQHLSMDKNKISLSQFKAETKVYNLKSALKIAGNITSVTASSNNVLKDFIIDTLAIKKYVSQTNRVTYTFRVYPIVSSIEPNKIYNLIYRKVGNHWATSIFLLTKKSITNQNQKIFNTIERIYDSEITSARTSKSSSRMGVCVIESFSVQCDGSCGSDECDGFACSTGQCIKRTISYDVCNETEPSGGDGGFYEGNFEQSGGGDYTYSPNTYEFDYGNDINYINNLKKDAVWNNMTSPMQLYFNTSFENLLQFDAIIQHQINNNWSQDSFDFGQDLIDEVFLNPTLNFDINATAKSPANIDRSTITNATPEGAKFNTVYDALTNSPEFKLLFIDLFQDNSRFNVKFEIAEHVYEDNDPTKKEVNATTSQIPGTDNSIIKISKQILIAGTTKSQTNIENAKTILHECIHAYLFVKANYPTAGKDFVKILNSMYPTPIEQHDFMYGFMIPTMQTVLGEIRDLVTTEPKRAVIEQYTMHPTLNPMTSTTFNWSDFYRNLSLSGLDETSCFKQDFQDPSDALRLHKNYIDAGKYELDR
ncbi:hypothetical protein [Flavobacterium sp.]|uniref:hypothetical protein n=1 Tax=Flavobacterium sp. TaxID=239 RepID=UPI00286D4043|nr:hypothetical protein [Flavobacterium sp.]